ncbi:MAG: RDD family protein [Chloroflexi bacterium]|nr:RDD family protein [Chloroflexota bacterium]
MQATATMDGVQYAGFWRRFAAIIIDNVVLFIIGLVVGLGIGEISSAGANVLGLIIGIVYIVGMWAGRGQTLGKMAMGVRIVKADGRPIDLGTAILRYVGYWVSGIILAIGFLMVAWDGKKQGLHDKIAGTYVVRV